MPAGKYYVGDLCYVMTDKEWEEVCELTAPKMGTWGKSTQGEFELADGRKFTCYDTKWGDGEYYDEIGHSYSVDAGAIGCIKLEDIKYVDNYDQFLDLGAIMEFDDSFATSGGRGDEGWEGLIQFGHIMIETNPVYEEE
jgi:hypothetical protein